MYFKRKEITMTKTKYAILHLVAFVIGLGVGGIWFMHDAKAQTVVAPQVTCVVRGSVVYCF
jgi:hypothetical protein